MQYREYAGFARAMAALRGTKLMFKGEDGKAVACNIKVSFDATKHLSDASVRRRQLERQKLRELEAQREEQKRREREAEERRRAEERERREAEQRERERRRGEKLRRRELRRERRRRRRRRAEEAETEVKPEAEAKPETEVKPEVEAGLRVRVRAEERKLLLAQRNLQSLRLVAALLGRAEAARLRDGRRRRAQQEAELRRVEEEQRRALGLQRRERELRRRLLGLLLARGPAPSGDAPTSPSGVSAPTSGPRDLLGPVLEVLQRVSARGPAPLGPEAPPPAAMETPTPPKPEEEVRQSRKRLARAGSGGEDDVVGDAREGRGRRGEGREQRRRSRHRRGGDHGRSRSPRKR